MFARIHASSLTVLASVVVLNLSAGLTPVLAQCEAAKLVVGGYGYLGMSVAIDGDTLVAGAAFDGGGSAYVFRFDGSGWVEEQKLLAGGGPEDQFGRSVAVCGDTVVVGAAGEEHMDGGDWARVYRFDGVSWVEEDEFQNGDESHFGFSAAIHGDAIIIGAPHDWENGHQAGAAYVFRYDGSGWVQEAKLLAVDDEPRRDRFGRAVAIDGDTAVIGAYYDGYYDHSWWFGAAYVFRFDGSSWFQEQKLASPGSSHFGYAVAIDGDDIVIGAPRGGDAYVFRFDGENWVQQQELVPSGEYGHFGQSVAIDGDSAVIGSWYQDDQHDFHGSAYVFRRDDNGTPLDPSDDFWLEQAKLMPHDPERENWFGYAAALDGRTAVIGDPYDGDDYAGAAYVFDVDPIPGDLDCDGCVGQADLGILLADWGCTGGDCAGDCDGDGDTDHADLGVLLAHWGEGCP